MGNLEDNKPFKRRVNVSYGDVHIIHKIVLLGNHLIHYIMIKEEVGTDDDDDDDDDDDGDEVTCKKVERHESDLGNMLIA